MRVFLGSLRRSDPGFLLREQHRHRSQNPKKPTLILDIDGHHGNGTQEVFQGDSKVFYVSVHRHPHYPGTGFRSERNCLNFPLPADVGEERYLETLDKGLSLVAQEAFDIVAVSAGFDTYAGDLASLDCRITAT